MQAKHLSVLILLLVSCSRQDTTQLKTQAGTVNNIVADDQSIPLNDLGAGTYKGALGGLYPGCANEASGQYAADLLTTSQSIVPIDTFGLVSKSKLSKIVFLSVGGSTGGHNMKLLKSKTDSNPLTNPNLKLLSANNGSGGSGLNNIMNPNDPYWNHVLQVLKGARSSYRQVQVVYLETDDSSKNISWPFRPNVVKNDLEVCLRVFKVKFPKIKVVYVLGRSRTFGAKAMWNREPSPYYMGWGCKWAIEDQINGVPGTEYKGANAVAPMLTWGFYQWADSLPRATDGFYWRFSETADGLHANAEGQDSLTTRFQNFLLTDPYASLWYAAH